MLPTGIPAIDAVAALDVIDIVVTVAGIEIIVDVDVSCAPPATAPAIAASATAAPHGAHRYADAEADGCGRDNGACRIDRGRRVHDGGIWVDRWWVNDGRIVTWNVNNLGI